MALILSRAGEIEKLPLPYRTPDYPEAIIREAADAYAAFNNSDPYAFKRMELHCRRGLENPYRIAPEYRSKVRARQIAATMRQEAKETVFAPLENAA